jgi:hypothetical protein
MGGSRLIAWGIGLAAVAFGIAVIMRETTIADHLIRVAVDVPSAPSHLAALAEDIKLYAWQLFSFSMLLILLWTKLR